MPEHEQDFEDYYLEGQEKYYEQEKQYWQEVADYNREWETKWPNYCKACNGWGSIYTPGKYSGPYDQCYPETVDECSAMWESSLGERCHRCLGELTEATEDQQPKCKVCGWSYDDGLRDY